MKSKAVVNTQVNKLIAFLRAAGRNKNVDIATPLMELVIEKNGGPSSEVAGAAVATANLQFWKELEDVTDAEAAKVGELLFKVCTGDVDGYRFNRVPSPSLVGAVRIVDFIIRRGKESGADNTMLTVVHAVHRTRVAMASKLVDDVVYKGRDFRK